MIVSPIVDGRPLPVDGMCDGRFAPVREAFVRNFTDLGEPGAAIALVVGGRVVVDLWAGWKDRARNRPWVRDTLVNFFSVGKALTALCALRVVEKGLVDLDRPLTRYWPEFGAHGKEAITLRHVLSHQAGLPALRAPLADGAMLDWPHMIRALENETPWWQPGTAHGYHVNTFGYLVGEVVRRTTGATLGALLREEMATARRAASLVSMRRSQMAAASTVSIFSGHPFCAMRSRSDPQAPTSSLSGTRASASAFSSRCPSARSGPMPGPSAISAPAALWDSATRKRASPLPM